MELYNFSNMKKALQITRVKKFHLENTKEISILLETYDVE